MGLDYRLNCYQCHESSDWVEFSITNSYLTKHLPEDDETLVHNWIPFLFQHTKHHKLDLVDARGGHSDPTQIKGAYVLGLEPVKK